MPLITEAIWYEFYVELLVDRYKETKEHWSTYTTTGKALLAILWACIVLWLLIVITEFRGKPVSQAVHQDLGTVFAIAAVSRWILSYHDLLEDKKSVGAVSA